MAVRVGTADFDISAEMARLTASDAAIGGVALFVGKVRDRANGEALAELILEHYPGMTEKALEKIEAAARARWPLLGVTIVHRVGLLAPLDQIVLVAGDADFIPAAKLARREGIDFILDPMWQGIASDLHEHIDGLQSVCPRPF